MPQLQNCLPQIYHQASSRKSIVKKTKLELKTVTPMFLHGYGNRILDLRPPSFKSPIPLLVADCAGLRREHTTAGRGKVVW